MNLTPEQQRLLKAAVFQTSKLYDNLGLSPDMAEYTLVVALSTIVAGRYSKDRVAFDQAVARHLEAFGTMTARARERIPEVPR